MKCTGIDELRFQREMNRKRRGQAEYRRMVARYDKECGECLTFKSESEYETYCEKRDGGMVSCG